MRGYSVDSCYLLFFLFFPCPLNVKSKAAKCCDLACLAVSEKNYFIEKFDYRKLLLDKPWHKFLVLLLSHGLI